MTVAEALDHLPHFSHDRADGAHVLTVDGTVYDERDPGVDVEFRVDGEAVDPTEYELQDGDSLSVVVTTGE